MAPKPRYKDWKPGECRLKAELLEPHAREVYLAVSRAFGKAEVPIDNWRRAMR